MVPIASGVASLQCRGIVYTSFLHSVVLYSASTDKGDSPSLLESTNHLPNDNLPFDIDLQHNEDYYYADDEFVQ